LTDFMMGWWQFYPAWKSIFARPVAEVDFSVGCGKGR
jgi:hypothetical protein